VLVTVGGQDDIHGKVFVIMCLLFRSPTAYQFVSLSGPVQIDWSHEAEVQAARDPSLLSLPSLKLRPGYLIFIILGFYFLLQVPAQRGVLRCGQRLAFPRDQAEKSVSQSSDAHTVGQGIHQYKRLDNLAVPALVIGSTSLASCHIVGILETLRITAGKLFKSIGIILVDIASLVNLHESSGHDRGRLVLY